MSDLLRRLVEQPKAEHPDWPFDYETGRCYWCGGGWEQVRGPRGGEGSIQHTGRHEDGCAFAEVQALL